MTGPTNEVWTLDSLLDCVVPDMHREQVLALVAEAYDAGRRDAEAERDAYVTRVVMDLKLAQIARGSGPPPRIPGR